MFTLIEIYLVLASPFVGSFLGILVMRLADGRPIAIDRSRCETCNQQLGIFELVPLVSWLWQRRNCLHCGATLGIFYPAMEISALFIAALSTGMLESKLSIPGCISGWLLLVLAVSDYRTFTLPNILTSILFIVGIFTAFLGGLDTLINAVIGAISGYLVFAAIKFAYSQIRHREGMGMGDVKLLGAGGAWVGWQGLPYTVLIATLAALLITLTVSNGSTRLNSTTRIPFGTFLAAGIWVVWFSKSHSLLQWSS